MNNRTFHVVVGTAQIVSILDAAELNRTDGTRNPIGCGMVAYMGTDAALYVIVYDLETPISLTVIQRP